MLAMHPTGIEPASKASEAYVLSIKLRVRNSTPLHLLQNCYITLVIITYYVAKVKKSLFQFLDTIFLMENRVYHLNPCHNNTHYSTKNLLEVHIPHLLLVPILKISIYLPVYGQAQELLRE